MKPNTLTLFLLAVALVPAIALSTPAVAQVDLTQIVTGGFNSTFMSTQTQNTQANIVISVRDFSQTDDFCGNSMSVPFPRPGSPGDGFDFPRAGRQSDDVPHPSRTITSFVGGATTYFQLPTGAQNPDIIGCVDTQRNTVFITIKPQRQAAPTPQTTISPSPNPLSKPATVQPSPADPFTAPSSPHSLAIPQERD